VPLPYLLPIAGVLLALLLVIALFSPRSPRFRRTTGAVYLILTLWLVAYPLCATLYHLLTDGGLRGAKTVEIRIRTAQVPIGKAAALHRSAPRLEGGLQADGVADHRHRITGLWRVFYLQASERLQQQWLADPSLARDAPAVTGARAIEASLRIMLDEDHAHWMRSYWGDDS